VNEALSHQIVERARAEPNEEIAELQSLLARREEEAKARLAAEIKRAEHVAEEKAKGSLALEIQDLRNQLAEAGKARDAAQTAELEARKRARELDERAKNVDLEAARKIDAERNRIEEEVARRADEQYQLKLAEKEKQIQDAKKVNDEVKRKLEQATCPLRPIPSPILLSSRVAASAAIISI